MIVVLHNMAWHREGHDPDYRFSLANERTFLAWIRTALAILASGVLLHQIAPGMRPLWVLTAGSVALAALAGCVGAAAYFHWRGNEIAMRHARALPRSSLLAALTLAIVFFGCGAAIFLMVQP
jgi:putative membrane protein